MRIPSFTPAERRVVRLISLGLSTKQVSRVLDKAVSTVDNQRTSAMRAAEISTATELVRVALLANITTLEDELTPEERRLAGVADKADQDSDSWTIPRKSKKSSMKKKGLARKGTAKKKKKKKGAKKKAAPARAGKGTKKVKKAAKKKKGAKKAAKGTKKKAAKTAKRAAPKAGGRKAPKKGAGRRRAEAPAPVPAAPIALPEVGGGPLDGMDAGS